VVVVADTSKIITAIESIVLLDIGGAINKAVSGLSVLGMVLSRTLSILTYPVNNGPVVPSLCINSFHTCIQYLMASYHGSLQKHMGIASLCECSTMTKIAIIPK
jgi:hypothetical protein